MMGVLWSVPIQQAIVWTFKTTVIDIFAYTRMWRAFSVTATGCYSWFFLDLCCEYNNQLNNLNLFVSVWYRRREEAQVVQAYWLGWRLHEEIAGLFTIVFFWNFVIPQNFISIHRNISAHLKRNSENIIPIFVNHSNVPSTTELDSFSPWNFYLGLLWK